jgi:cysteine protease ATG4
LLYSCLSFPLSIGIAGGKPNTSFYFVGFHGTKFFYLDPHKLQRSAKGSFKWNMGSDPVAKQAEETLRASYFCSDVQSLAVEDMDPCMSVGFYCHDEKQIESFWSFAVEMSKEPYCVFSVSDAKGGRTMASAVLESLSAQIASEEEKDGNEAGSDDDFVVVGNNN